MSGEEIRNLLAALGDLRSVIRTADPAERRRSTGSSGWSWRITPKRKRCEPRLTSIRTVGMIVSEGGHGPYPGSGASSWGWTPWRSSSGRAAGRSTCTLRWRSRQRRRPAEVPVMT